jgi:predicted metalloenzyme YecM
VPPPGTREFQNIDEVSVLLDKLKTQEAEIRELKEQLRNNRHLVNAAQETQLKCETLQKDLEHANRRAGKVISENETLKAQNSQVRSQNF